MKTVCFIEVDEVGEIEWSEGCICVEDVFENSKELVYKEDALLIIKKLEERINEMSWTINPERMGR